MQITKVNLLQKKNGIQGHFENSRWNVNHRMMKGLQKYPLQKEKKRSSERRSNVSSLFPAWLAPCKLCADAFPLRHQTKSEMQVEFYVSDIQEVRRICSAIPLATFPPPQPAAPPASSTAARGTRQPPSPDLPPFQPFHFHPHAHFFFLTCNHSDTCLTRHSLVAERY